MIPGIILSTISIDIVVDGTMGNVMLPSTRMFWFNSVRSGQVLAYLAGPPCETWSAARHQQLGDVRRAPRPIRSATELWGFTSVSLREARQLETGNALLTFCLVIMSLLWSIGGFGMVEHPRCPHASDLASIWRLVSVRAMMTLPGHRLVHIRQSLFGAPSSKPTTLWCLNIPKAAGVLASHHLSDEVPQGCSIGVDESGSWRASVLKEYPPALCRAMASLFGKVMTSAPLTEVVLDAKFRTVCAAMQNSYSAFLGPDFAQASNAKPG